MPSLHPYPSYRNTGLPWLGKIPAHWDITKVKRGYEIRLGKMLRPEPLSSSDTLEPYLRAANIQWQDVDTNDVKEMWFSQWEKPLYELQEGDLMVCEGGDVGRAAIWQGQLEKCYIQNSVHRVRNREGFTNKFLYYWLVTLKSKGYIDLLCNKATIAHFTADKFATIELIAPPLPEQQAIAAYLDRQTAKIDALIARKERLLDLLAEQRAALISQAVTKGLPPSPRGRGVGGEVKMKDSGVAWLGQIPSHWEVKRLKYLSSVNPSRSETNHLPEDTEVTFLPMELVGNGSINTEKTKKISDVKQGFTYMIDGDIIVAKITPSFENGKGAIANGLTNGIGFGTTELHVIRPKHGMITKYLYYLTTSYIFRNIGAGMMQGTAGQKRVPDDFISNFKAPVPSIDEQEKIVEYLNYQTKRLTDLATKVETAIERLREYRAALISSAVTGKVQVAE